MSSRRAPWVTLGVVVTLGAAVLAVWFARPAAAPEAAPKPVPSSATPSPSPTPSATPDPWDGWTLEQQVGQVFMVGVNVGDPKAVSTSAIRDDHVGNLFLQGRTTAGADAVRSLVDSFTALVGPTSTHSTPLLVATDQEGGEVQVLRGPGFSTIPSALEQASLSPAALQSRAATWGSELAAVGVNLDLAPVMDLVDGVPADNPPVGALDRSYGFTADSVTTHANAFSAGLSSAGVGVSIKHFPGLGRVTANTDDTAGVTDSVTTRDDASVGVFRAGIAADPMSVMVSTAIYSRIDPDNPAAFSSTVVTGMLRGDLGYDGLVVTDDLSGATQVVAWEPGERAVLALQAGVDLVLVSKDPTVAHEMVTAVLDRARSDPAFAAQVRAAAQRVLVAKGEWLSPAP
ncbi:glycoside hydrolase family 3 N-terminal domain-containing protein [Cellulomonas sp. PhB150]|uniref:glycoside hydrolase family 3 N-terminal domain-containing protein n=1 Tax=Cellulomonas sp. PhB150 TaxID=2485188 RepID=UPI000F936B95|nr:glycoside hydrolase family 3 N-terminal domain-containing protein [Cellulomonas sp. PhB150]ROS28052.1 beta-N-acetylhexosaminidase [Cellulomonas sp. PhB150]